jgi:ASC-1-like (ASCH) protein
MNITRGEGSMNFRLSLYPTILPQIASGEKTVEIRLASQKRLKMQPGDTITFYCKNPKRSPIVDEVTKTITKIKLYYSFESMLDHEDYKAIGDPSREKCLKDLKGIYHYDFTSMVMAIHLK